MSKVLDPFRFVLVALAGAMNHRRYQVIHYLREENRVLREQLADRRLRFNDDQRRVVAPAVHSDFRTIRHPAADGPNPRLLSLPRDNRCSDDSLRSSPIASIICSIFVAPLVREVGVRVGACVLWAVIVVVCHYNVTPLGTSLVLHSLVGVALGLLLVFRTDHAAQRSAP